MHIKQSYHNFIYDIIGSEMTTQEWKFKTDGYKRKMPSQCLVMETMKMPMKGKENKQESV